VTQVGAQLAPAQDPAIIGRERLADAITAHLATPGDFVKRRARLVDGLFRRG